ncbi:hypothetical protein GCM10023184_31100 [Flaviaesturariibacter amylovorans]|uniref:Uncharacterized protein n=1 Tax=Flaviaesturariibacter amylovorans TaxID=1084520 RepID=A0ABP8H973_9BACT
MHMEAQKWGQSREGAPGANPVIFALKIHSPRHNNFLASPQNPLNRNYRLYPYGEGCGGGADGG